MTFDFDWSEQVSPEALRHVTHYVYAQLQQALGLTLSHEEAVTFSLTYVLVGVSHMLRLALESATPGTEVRVVDQLQSGPPRPNLYVLATSERGKAAQGMKIALADTLLLDWEQPGLGLSEPWQTLLLSLPVTARDGEALSGLAGRILLALEAGADRPLRFRARMNTILLGGGSPEEQAQARADLMREFGGTAMRSQAFQGKLPTTDEIRDRFRDMPWQTSEGPA